MADSSAGYTFSVEDAVQGHYVYKEIWDPIIGEVLCCEREVGNSFDPQAVAVNNSGEIVGHVPRRISSICSSFLHHGGSIICTITGHRRYAAGLENGGLEVPCTFKFVSPPDQTAFGEKTEKQIRYSLTIKVPASSVSVDKNKPSCVAKPSTGSNIGSVTGKSSPAKLSIASSDGNATGTSSFLLVSPNETITIHSEPNDEISETAVQPALKKPRLTDEEFEDIIMGGKLSDAHINRAQKILKCQFLHVNGLESTLLQGKEIARTKEMVENKLQIVYCTSREHWIVATTVNNRNGEVLIFDSVFNSLDDDTV